MRKRAENYISIGLPLITILLVGTLVFNPDITGLVVSRNEYALNASISLSLSEEVALPLGSTIHVFLGGKEYRMTSEEFLEKTGKPFSIGEAPTPPSGEVRRGYLGEGDYVLDISEFGISPIIKAGSHNLRTVIKNRDEVISESIQVIET